MAKLRAVFFDLDGTLADTAPDLAAALNHTRADEGLPPLPHALIRPWVSAGSSALVRMAFDPEPNPADFAARRLRFLTHYAAELTHHTRLFPGMETVITTLEAQGIAWGIVTNKPAWLTEPLVRQLGYYERAACVVSGDTTPHPKPHPAPLLHACAQVGCNPAAAVYVGDARRDIEAGQRAGMPTLAALFGYIEPGDDPTTWGAQAYLDAPLALLTWLTENQETTTA
jgi:phosphoglycolate phosphatase